MGALASAHNRRGVDGGFSIHTYYSLSWPLPSGPMLPEPQNDTTNYENDVKTIENAEAK